MFLVAVGRLIDLEWLDSIPLHKVLHVVDSAVEEESRFVRCPAPSDTPVVLVAW